MVQVAGRPVETLLPKLRKLLRLFVTPRQSAEGTGLGEHHVRIPIRRPTPRSLPIFKNNGGASRIAALSWGGDSHWLKTRPKLY